MHYIKLILRSLLFLLCLALYLWSRLSGSSSSFGFFEQSSYMIWAVALVFMLEMCLRFFPSRIESMGCRKQFGRNYQPTGSSEPPRIDSNVRTAAVLASWIAINSLVALLFFLKIIDREILVLISLAYSVCDMICILFFCPFQTWMMKNKCCGSCRIYNWDFIMMFTPCVFIDHPAARMLFGFAALLCLQWEIIYKLHPERFAENTNAFLSCGSCTEKLCAHKKQLQRYLVVFRQRLAEEKRKMAQEKLEEKL